jgi:hypothetical protein
MEAYFEYQSTEEGDKMRRLLEDLRRMAIQFVMNMMYLVALEKSLITITFNANIILIL